MILLQFAETVSEVFVIRISMACRAAVGSCFDMNVEGWCMSISLETSTHSEHSSPFERSLEVF